MSLEYAQIEKMENNHVERNKILIPVEGWNQMVKYNKLANVDGEEILL